MSLTRCTEPGSGTGGIVFNPEQKLRIHQQPLESSLDPGLEAAVGIVAAAHLVEREHRVDVRDGNRTAKRAARER